MRRGGLATATARNAGKGERISSKVFVGNLSFDTSMEELQELFAQGEDGVQVSLPTDRMTGRTRTWLGPVGRFVSAGDVLAFRTLLSATALASGALVWCFCPSRRMETL